MTMRVVKPLLLMWQVLVLVLLLVLVQCSAGVGAGRVDEVRANWTRYRQAALVAAPVARDEELGAIMKKHRGVYQDAERNRRMGLADTVVVIVQLIQHQVNNSRPRMALLNNMICHLERHGLMTALYLSRYLFNASIPVESHFVPNNAVLYVPFPDLSFWNMLVSFGRTSMPSPKQKSKLPYPNFKEYGDKAVLFTVLEMLQLGLNVILLDDDVMLLRDPVPFLINNHITADIVTPEDTRQCTFLANPLLDVSKWKSLQPEINLGVTFFRSRPIIIQLVRRWMNLIHYNGQKAFFPFRRVMETDNSCHSRRRGIVNAPDFNFTHENSKRMSICYLSNTLFQNGYVNSFRCGKFDKNPVYALTLSEEVLLYKDYFLPRKQNMENFTVEMLLSSDDLNKVVAHYPSLSLLTPVTVHPNYEAKELTIKNYLFWVYETDTSGGSIGSPSMKKCKKYETTRHSKLNLTHSLLFKFIQKRKTEALRFLQNHIDTFFYTSESLPQPEVVFLLREDLIFEAFDIVPGSFVCNKKLICTAEIFSRDHASRLNGVVTVTAISIFGVKSTALVATLPVRNHSGFWKADNIDKYPMSKYS